MTINGKYVLARRLTPSALIFLRKSVTESAIVGNFAATIDDDVDVFGIVKGFRSIPEDGKRCRRAGCLRRKLRVATFNDVAEELGRNVRHSSLDVELTDEIGLRDKLGNILHFDLDTLLVAVRHENLRRNAVRRVDSRTESRSTAPSTRPDPLLTNDIES